MNDNNKTTYRKGKKRSIYGGNGAETMLAGIATVAIRRHKRSVLENQ